MLLRRAGGRLIQYAREPFTDIIMGGMEARGRRKPPNPSSEPFLKPVSVAKEPSPLIRSSLHAVHSSFSLLWTRKGNSRTSYITLC
jgi:hypothetical protein